MKPENFKIWILFGDWFWAWSVLIWKPSYHKEYFILKNWKENAEFQDFLRCVMFGSIYVLNQGLIA